MEQHPPRNPPPPAPGRGARSFPPDAHPPASLLRSHWTPAKQRIFLAALVESGSVAGAARAAGMSRSSAHRLRERLAGTPFVIAWDHALQLHARRLADPFGSASAAPAAHG